MLFKFYLNLLYVIFWFLNIIIFLPPLSLFLKSFFLICVTSVIMITIHVPHHKKIQWEKIEYLTFATVFLFPLPIIIYYIFN